MSRFGSFEEYQYALEAVVKDRYEECGEGLPFDPYQPGLDVAHVLEAHEDDDFDFAQCREWRFRMTKRLLEFLAADGVQPGKILKRLLVVMRCAAPHLVLHMNQDHVGIILNESKQAVQTREEKVWEAFLKAAGAQVVARPNGKSKEARERYSEERKGMQSRKGGNHKMRRVTVLRPEFEKRLKRKNANRKP